MDGKERSVSHLFVERIRALMEKYGVATMHLAAQLGYRSDGTVRSYLDGRTQRVPVDWAVAVIHAMRRLGASEGDTDARYLLGLRGEQEDHGASIVARLARAVAIVAHQHVRQSTATYGSDWKPDDDDWRPIESVESEGAEELVMLLAMRWAREGLCALSPFDVAERRGLAGCVAIHDDMTLGELRWLLTRVTARPKDRMEHYQSAEWYADRLADLRAAMEVAARGNGG